LESQIYNVNVTNVKIVKRIVWSPIIAIFSFLVEGLRNDWMAKVATAGDGSGVSRAPCAVSRVRGEEARLVSRVVNRSQGPARFYPLRLANPYHYPTRKTHFDTPPATPPFLFAYRIRFVLN
jgi:hypothetical protein